MEENFKLIGRQKEIVILEACRTSSMAELVAITGRRRIGKTYLVTNVFSSDLSFHVSGILNSSVREQLYHFHQQLIRFGLEEEELPKSWIEAFHHLARSLDKRVQQKKHVLFFDELPWLDIQHSGFLRAFSSFWNDWASMQKVVVIICGSASSWMMQKVVQDKGGLHNRITHHIKLQPFTLAEAGQFMQYKGIVMSRHQILELYMVTGGIPHYLNSIKPGKSAVQNINQICFESSGVLNDEFSKLYAALFKHPTRYIQIIRALATKWKGLTREEIISRVTLSDGGSVTKILNDLELSGFIQSYKPFSNVKKNTLYRLTDPYSLFYLRFIENNPYSGQNVWLQLSQTQTWKSWSGYAFENVCLIHSEGIKKALGVSGILTKLSSYVFKGNETHDGFQIDLLIDRADNAINICEMKYYSADVTITKTYARQLRNRLATFREIANTKKQLFLTLVTTHGLRQNKNSMGLIDHVIDLDALFEVKEF
jgi:uncharacterized protein